MWVKIPQAVNPRVPDQRLSDQGESGPKVTPARLGQPMANGLIFPYLDNGYRLRRDAAMTPARPDGWALK